jgi:mRNA interferase RelE/StbE
MVDPISFGKPLRYSLRGHRRLRVSDYRVVFRIEAVTHNVIIVAITHHKDVYEDA